MIISAHQSQFIPWLPYFKKIAKSDVFVWMDNVQFHRRGFQNRSLIASKQGEKWLSIPLVKGKQEDLICVKTTSNSSWIDSHLTHLKQHYKNAPYFKETMGLLADIYLKVKENNMTNLNDINMLFFSTFIKLLNMNTPIKTLSELSITSSKSDLILDICKTLNATEYLTGTGAKDYLQESDFTNQEINISYLSSKPPYYKIANSPFLVGLSIIDMMMHQPLENVIQEINDG